MQKRPFQRHVEFLCTFLDVKNHAQRRICLFQDAEGGIVWRLCQFWSVQTVWRQCLRQGSQHVCQATGLHSSQDTSGKKTADFVTVQLEMLVGN